MFGKKYMINCQYIFKIKHLWFSWYTVYWLQLLWS